MNPGDIPFERPQYYTLIFISTGKFHLSLNGAFFFKFQAQVVLIMCLIETYVISSKWTEELGLKVAYLTNFDLFLVIT